MSRLGGRFVPNIEHEVRRQATEPIVKWRQEWVVPSGTLADGTASSSSANVGVKILKWVRVPDELVTFPEDQDVSAEDRVADDAAIVEVPVQSIHNAPAVPTPVGGSLSSAGGGLGTIAPREPPSTPASAPSAAAVGSEVTPASAIPAHLAQPTLSEPTSGNNTTGDNTPTDSIANTPTASAPDAVPTQAPSLSQQASSQGGEPAISATGTDAGTPQIQPQVESQLHQQPVPEPTTDDATLAALAAGAEAEQPADQDDTLLSTDLNASVPATTFEDDQPGAGAGGDVEMNDA